MNIDEDTDAENEPRLLRLTSLTGDDDGVQVEPPMTAKYIHPLGEGEVQKIEKSETEDEIVVVDDYLENKEPEKAVQEREEQKKEDLAEAAQENSQTDSDTEAKTDQSFESAKEEHDDGGKETDKPVQESKAEVDQTKEEGKKTETQTVGGEEAKQDGTLNDKRSSSDSSDSDDFVEVRPEGEKVQDAKLVTSQVNLKHGEEGASGGGKGTAPVEERMDIQQYYLRKKPSVPPPLPPKEKHYF